MSRMILNQAVACGGTARGFDQGQSSMTCAVFGSDWLAAKLKADGSDPVFEQAEPKQPDLNAVPFYFAGTPESAVAGSYEMGKLMDFDGRQKVQVKVCDYKPKPEYLKAATEMKNTWGPFGNLIKPRVIEYLKQRAGLQLGGQAPEFTVSPPDEAELAGLLVYLKKPGNNVWALRPQEIGQTGHIMATYCTAERFWIFDSLRGEAGVPLEQVDNWFSSEYVKSYLGRYGTFSAWSFVPQE